MGAPMGALVIVFALIVIPTVWPFCYLVSAAPGGSDLGDSLDLCASLPGTRCDVVVLLLNRSARQVQHLVAEGLVKQFIGDTPVGRYCPVLVGNVEHRKCRGPAVSLFARDRKSTRLNSSH